MTPKEKAQELFDKFNNPDRTNYPYYSHNAQQCALIAVEEILNDPFYTNTINISGVYYWQEVKKEIEAL
jgi:hypothetical protein